MKFLLEGRWLALVAIVAVVFAGILALAVRFVSLPATPPAAKPPTARTSGIGIASGAGISPGSQHEEQSLLDPDPLFLPTEFNASQPKLPSAIRREPGTSFQPVLAKFAYTVAEAGISFPEVVAVPIQVVDALDYGRVQNPYEVFGRFKRDEHPLPSRLAVVEVLQAKTGRQILSVSLQNLPDAPPQLASSDWRPIELLAAIDVTGLIGTPMLSRGSGVEAVDVFLRSYLANQFHLGERLPPGFYTVRVGP